MSDEAKQEPGCERFRETDDKPGRNASDLASCWFVESVVNGTFEGWWAQPPKGIGGWLTQNPHEAKRYTREQADSVATALSYFPTPFRWSNWVATEHSFLGATTDSSVPESVVSALADPCEIAAKQEPCEFRARKALRRIRESLGIAILGSPGPAISWNDEIAALDTALYAPCSCEHVAKSSQIQPLPSISERLAGWLVEEARDRYRWRPIAEIHEDYGDVVLVNVNDCGDLHIGSNLNLDWDESKWTHFTRFAPIGQAEYERMRDEVEASRKPMRNEAKP